MEETTLAGEKPRTGTHAWGRDAQGRWQGHRPWQVGHQSQRRPTGVPDLVLNQSSFPAQSWSQLGGQSGLVGRGRRGGPQTDGSGNGDPKAGTAWSLLCCYHLNCTAVPLSQRNAVQTSALDLAGTRSLRPQAEGGLRARGPRANLQHLQRASPGAGWAAGKGCTGCVVPAGGVHASMQTLFTQVPPLSPGLGVHSPCTVRPPGAALGPPSFTGREHYCQRPVSGLLQEKSSSW